METLQAGVKSRLAKAAPLDADIYTVPLCQTRLPEVVDGDHKPYGKTHLNSAFSEVPLLYG